MSGVWVRGECGAAHVLAGHRGAFASRRAHATLRRALARFTVTSAKLPALKNTNTQLSEVFVCRAAGGGGGGGVLPSMHA